MNAIKITESLLKLINNNAIDLAQAFITGEDPILPSPFLIGEAGAAVIATNGLLSAQLWSLKSKQTQKISISVRDAAIAQRSHAYLKCLDHETPELWSPISGFYKTKDHRWIQFHCNFPHHRKGVISLLKCKENREAVEEAVLTWNAETLENTLAEQNMCAAIVRSPEEWKQHPQYKASASLPLMEIIKIGDSKPEPLPEGNQPLSNIRVLDLSRVVAGPVCGKTLAEHGATVMRISNPDLPSIPPLVMDTGFGKLSAFLNLNKQQDKNTLVQLIKKADIFSQAYRPGGLAEKGFSPEDVIKLRPGCICISLSAYSHVGPWANRRGFDSLVQSATGMVFEQSANKKPQHLPTQTLDYLTGFLAASGAMEALRRRTLEGGSYLVRVSLLQTAHWFSQLGRVSNDFMHCQIPTRDDIIDLLTQSETPFGKLEHLLPVLKMSLTPPHWNRNSVPLGTDKPEWP